MISVASRRRWSALTVGIVRLLLRMRGRRGCRTRSVPGARPRHVESPTGAASAHDVPVDPSRGSSASRSPSPTKLMPAPRRRSGCRAAPRARASRCRIVADWARLIMLPQLAVGGCTPRPRKDSPASVRIAAGDAEGGRDDHRRQGVRQDVAEDQPAVARPRSPAPPRRTPAPAGRGTGRAPAGRCRSRSAGR